MMMGLPCISTDCAGSSEVIVSGENGILVPIGNKEELVKAMTLLINNRELAIYLGKKAAESAIQFSSTNIISKWEMFLE
jgi:GalNAc-alpha-(1->4)-GalNAc-alpha-(1->3)-diNAcBac-PP-undecaprenol alpha-1,4-N-acetyl-D-galactosaminyltransferase